MTVRDFAMVMAGYLFGQGVMLVCLFALRALRAPPRRKSPPAT